MSRAQGDWYRTWTDVEMNKRVAEHNRKWDELIKPYYEEPGAAEGQQVKTCGAGPIPARRITGKIKNIIPDTRRKGT